jgi:hypothetical protein
MVKKSQQPTKTKKEKTKEEQRLDISTGEQDEEVYTAAGREQLVEDDEMEPWEEGFMEGAEGRGQMTSCARCGKLLGQGKAKTFERKINGKKMLFCSKEHAEKGARD